MLYAKKLKKNDLIGVCAPASPVDRESLNKGIRFLKKLGLQIILGKNIYQRNHYLAGTDEQRLDDFNTLLKDDNVKAIFFARGGYGTARIAPFIDYEWIRKHPKIIWGFSDITYLHIAIFQKTGLITFHGPMVSSFGNEKVDEITKNEIYQLFSPSIRTYDETISPLHVLVEGKSTGRIIGGNLSLIVRTIGTPYEIDLKNKILFIEDTGEKLYKIDFLINQLKQSKKLDELAGVVIGDFNDVFIEDKEILNKFYEDEKPTQQNVENEREKNKQNKYVQKQNVSKEIYEKKGNLEENNEHQLVKNETTTISHQNQLKLQMDKSAIHRQQLEQQLLNQLFYHYFKDLQIPVMSGFKIGHCFPNFAIPFGAHAKLCTRNKQLIIEPGVK